MPAAAETDQQLLPTYYPLLCCCCLEKEPLVLGLRVSIAAAILNIVGYTLFPILIVYEHVNYKEYWRTMNPPGSGLIRSPWQQTAPPVPITIPYSTVVDGSIPMMLIFLLLLVPNCLVLRFKKAWAAYLWIETNVLGTLCMIIWTTMVSSDQAIRALQRTHDMTSRNDNPSPSGPSLAFDLLWLLIVFGGLGIWFSILMFQYAKALEAPAPPNSVPNINRGQPTRGLMWIFSRVGRVISTKVRNYLPCKPKPAPLLPTGTQTANSNRVQPVINTRSRRPPTAIRSSNRLVQPVEKNRPATATTSPSRASPVANVNPHPGPITPAPPANANTNRGPIARGAVWIFTRVRNFLSCKPKPAPLLPTGTQTPNANRVQPDINTRNSRPPTATRSSNRVIQPVQNNRPATATRSSNRVIQPVQNNRPATSTRSANRAQPAANVNPHPRPTTPTRPTNANRVQPVPNTQSLQPSNTSPKPKQNKK